MILVVDASTLLSFIFEEDGGETALARSRGAMLSTVNLFEVTAKARGYKGLAPASVEGQLARLGLEFIPFDREQAMIAASLPAKIGKQGLAMADRACLALAIAFKCPVLTGDRAWAELDLGIEIQLFR